MEYIVSIFGRKKWLYPITYIILFFASSFIPHYTSTGYNYFGESGKVIVQIMSVSLEKYLSLSPIFHMATFVLLILVWKYGNRVGRYFCLYFGVNLIFIALTQCIATTADYGFSIMTGTMLAFLLIGSLWIWESFNPKTNVEFSTIPLSRYWVLPLAIFAFWSPMNLDLQPDFSPVLLLNSLYGVGGCVTLPVFIFLLTLLYPRVNEPVYRITAFVGLIYGFWNMFSLLKPHTRWLGIIHIPLLVISLYALILPHFVKKKQIN